MKSKIFTLAFISLLSVPSLLGCPIWLLGKVYVVNEKNQFINATVSKITDSDSFMKQKGSLYKFYIDTINIADTNVFEFWSNGGWYYRDEAKIIRSYYRIHSEGYADLIIKDIEFIRSDRRTIPVLIIKMYPKKFYRMADKMSLIEQYAFNEKVMVTDSTELNYSYYIKNLEERATAQISDAALTLLAIESYPNPVNDYMILKINSIITEPYVLKLMDNQGKLLKQSYLTAAETKFDLQWTTKGNYIVLVYNPKGVPIFSRQFIKM